VIKKITVLSKLRLRLKKERNMSRKNKIKGGGEGGGEKKIDEKKQLKNEK
jgi:hypothetical protein